MTKGVEFEMNGFAETALQFINSTSGHIFFTGKAGTGKTTFLKNLTLHTHKQFVVVAPTGIAALNAGGVTIHSQFLLPLGTFVPGRSDASDLNVEENVYTQNTLARKHPLNSIRKQVLRSIDLLVIDEVSMLRADILDAIDYRLKAARGNFGKDFGGVQLLLIGDLYQLPPVVRRNEESLMRRNYSSPWFYESLALKQSGFVYIELEKIFRQQDNTFIHILNNLRNNTPTVSDIEELNRHYLPEVEIGNLKEVITLTTHNYKADEMNVNALRSLETDSHFFEAEIEGEFPESMYPVQSRLELKEGAQIMFIRNDSENQMYFNGKLATVNKISGYSVTVILADSHTCFELKREIWENKKYTINKDNNDLDDEVIGTFSQYPVKLAWAITVHKSQGLTFEKAIVDVGQAFTGGQVYVALSRLRSLDGLILRSIINPGVISADHQIVSFSENNNKPEELPEVMKRKQTEFISLLVERTFDFSGLTKEIGYISKSDKHTATLDDPSMKPVLEQIGTALDQERENTMRFRRQLIDLIKINDQ
ncbi:MAG: AAA family ATPase, partial [Cyclobacteriaceae bacterium]